MNKKIAIVTPLKDEMESIQRLVRSIESQSVRVYCWVIVENDSTDGSNDYLNKIKNVKNVDYFKVLNISFTDKRYELGIKYSTVVNKGFQYLKNEIGLNEINYVGILDADCFPEKKYYEKLLSTFDSVDGLGITSGRILFENGKEHFINDNHIRGSGRLWSVDCFNDSGYIIGMSADTLSATKARLHGWKVQVTPEAEVISREAGARAGFQYYGRASYYRGDPILYAVLRALKNLVYFRFKFAYGFFTGYMSSYINKENRVEDSEIKNYYKNRRVWEIK